MAAQAGGGYPFSRHWSHVISDAVLRAWVYRQFAARPEFAGAAQVAQLRRTVTKKGKNTVEVVYLITNDRDADLATLADWVRSHWHIENKLHWVRDFTYQEDKSLVRTANALRVMARCAAWASASCAWTATRTSPPPTGTTPETRGVP